MRLVAADGQDNARLDAFLAASVPGLSRRRACELIESGEVSLNGRICTLKAQPLQPGDQVEIEPPQIEWSVQPEPELPLRIAYEDRWLVAVDKPPLQHAHPLECGERGTLVAALLARFPETAGVGFGPEQPGLVNRIDYHTSGLVLAARDQQTFEALRAQFGFKAVLKSYLALVGGAPESSRLTWPIGAAGRGNPRVRVLREPGTSARAMVEARTDVFALERLRGAALVLATMRTGARHQVRAHLAAAGWPILGDPLYGDSRAAGRTMLHASGLELLHPITHRPLEIRCPTPDDFEQTKTLLSIEVVA